MVTKDANSPDSAATTSAASGVSTNGTVKYCAGVAQVAGADISKSITLAVKSTVTVIISIFRVAGNGNNPAIGGVTIGGVAATLDLALTELINLDAGHSVAVYRRNDVPAGAVTVAITSVTQNQPWAAAVGNNAISFDVVIIWDKGVSTATCA